MARTRTKYLKFWVTLAHINTPVPSSFASHISDLQPKLTTTKSQKLFSLQSTDLGATPSIAMHCISFQTCTKAVRQYRSEKLPALSAPKHYHLVVKMSLSMRRLPVCVRKCTNTSCYQSDACGKYQFQFVISSCVSNATLQNASQWVTTSYFYAWLQASAAK
jgi:hypothetical protein